MMMIGTRLPAVRMAFRSWGPCFPGRPRLSSTSVCSPAASASSPSRPSVTQSTDIPRSRNAFARLLPIIGSSSISRMRITLAQVADLYEVTITKWIGSLDASVNFSNPGGLEQHDEGWTCRENRLRLFGPDVVVPSFCEKTQLQPQEHATQ